MNTELREHSAGIDGGDTAEAGPWLARLEQADAAVRRVALLERTDLGDAALVPAFLVSLREDSAREVRREAAAVLASWESDEVVEALCAALLDDDDTVRTQAVQSLSEFKESSSGPVLCRWATRQEPFVRCADCVSCASRKHSILPWRRLQQRRLMFGWKRSQYWAG